MKNKRSKFKSCTAFLLALVMVVTLIPGNIVSAADDATEITQPGYDDSDPTDTSTPTIDSDENAGSDEPGGNTTPVDPVTPPTDGGLPTDTGDSSGDVEDPVIPGVEDPVIPGVDENPALDPEELEPEAFAVPFAAGDITVGSVADLQNAVSQAIDDITVTLSDTFPTDINATIDLTNTNDAKITIDGNYNGAHKELTAVDKSLFSIKATNGSQIILKNFVLDGSNATKLLTISASSGTDKSKAVIENCAFLNGKAMFGAAISLGNNANVKIDGCSFIDNLGYWGGHNGGAIASNQQSNINLEITNSYFKGNEFSGGAPGGTGGAIGIYNAKNSSLIVDHCVFDQNECTSETKTSDGGAIAFKNQLGGAESTFTVSNSTFYGNLAGDDAGAILIEGGESGDINLEGNIYNCTFVENKGSDKDNGGWTAAANGGAIQIYGKASANIYYNTFYGNGFRNNPSTCYGGAISGSNANVANNLFVENTVTRETSAYQNVYSCADSGGNIGYDNGAKISYPKSAVEFGTTAPILENLYDSTISNVVGYQDDEDYSTAVTTIRVAPEAEAYNAAIATAGIGTSDSVTLDQNGRARGSRLTAGAVEVNWVKYDANGGSWKATDVVANQTGYNADGTTYYHRENSAAKNEDVYYTVHAEYTDQVSVITEEPETPVLGYEFSHWNTEADDSGEKYNANALLPENLESLTLYAIWPDLYTVTYSANYNNGPKDVPDAGHTRGNYTVLHNTMFTRSKEHIFTGWNTNEDGSGDFYGAGSSLDLKGDTTLYAQWDSSLILTYYKNALFADGPTFYDDPAQLKPGVPHTIAGEQYFSRSGYNIHHWNTMSDGKGESYYEGDQIAISENTSLYAIWARDIELTYNENWGDSESSHTDKTKMYTICNLDEYTVLSPDHADLLFEAPTGKAFIGWCEKKTPSSSPNPTDWHVPGGVIPPTIYKKTLYAQWTDQIANITFNANGTGSFTATFNDNSGEQKAVVGLDRPILQSVVDALPAFSPSEGYVFDGNWYEDAECTDKWEFSTDIARDKLVLYAGWIPKYIVTFDANDGEFDDPAALEQQELSFGSGSLIPVDQDGNPDGLPDLTYTDHTFDGWYKDEGCTEPWGFVTDKVEGDITLFAKWTASTKYYDVTYDGKGATSGIPANSSKAAGSTFNIGGEPTRSGYTFDGWKSSDDGKTYDAGTEYTMPENNVTFTALWSKNGGGGGSTKYKVTYDANGGKGQHVTSGMSSGTSHKILTVGKTSITNSGYRFIGWSKTPTGNVVYDPGDSITVNKNIRLYAQWEDVDLEDAYTIVYSPNGGDGEKYSIIEQVGDTHTVLSVSNAALEYTNNGYVFRGWSTDPSATTPTYFGTGSELIGDDAEEGDVITLYAIWAKLPEIPASAIPLGDLDYENHFAYIIGYPDGSVQPNGDITRAEIATIFLRLLTQDSRAELWKKTNDFSDVLPGSWYNNAVSTLANGNVLKGYPDGTFLPDGSITRAELAAIAARFATVEDIKNMAGNATFTDITGHWAEDSIILAGAVGFLPEYSDGPFKPDQPITRAEVATMLNHVLKRHVNSEDDLQPGYKAWPDNLPGAAYYFDILEATNSHSYEASPDGIGEVWTKLIASPNWALLGGPDAESRDLVY